MGALAIPASNVAEGEDMGGARPAVAPPEHPLSAGDVGARIPDVFGGFEPGADVGPSSPSGAPWWDWTGIPPYFVARAPAEEELW